MSIQGKATRTDDVLDFLSEQKLYAYGYSDIAKFLVALETALSQEFPTILFNERRAPLSWLMRVAKTLQGVKQKISIFDLSGDDPLLATQANVIRHIGDIFWNSYRLTQEQIDQASFNQTVYDLLHELELRTDHYQVRQGAWWDDRSKDEIQLERENKRRALLDFVRENPAAVVAQVYHWASRGEGHQAIISNDHRQLFELFGIMKDLSSPVANGRLTRA